MQSLGPDVFTVRSRTAENNLIGPIGLESPAKVTPVPSSVWWKLRLHVGHICPIRASNSILRLDRTAVNHVVVSRCLPSEC